MQALILAGGKGTRLRPLTLHTPKPIVPIVNRPFLLFQIDLLKRAGIRDIVLSLSYQPKKIEDILGDGSEFGVHLRYTVEAQPLGTAGAYKNAEEHIGETTIVFNGDILTDIDLKHVIDYHGSRNAAATIVLTRVKNPMAYGLVETAPEGEVRRFLEKPKADEITCNTINAGIYVLEPSVLKYIPEAENYSFEYGLFPELLARKQSFFAWISNDYWLDIGTPQRYLQGHHDVLADKLSSYKPGARTRGEKFDAQAVIDSVSLIDPTTVIRAGAKIENSVIGANCFIEEKVRVSNSVIWSGTRIAQSALVSGSVLCKSCFVGRFAELRGACVLGDKSVVSDYSQLGDSKSS